MATQQSMEEQPTLDANYWARKEAAPAAAGPQQKQVMGLV